MKKMKGDYKKYDMNETNEPDLHLSTEGFGLLIQPK